MVKFHNAVDRLACPSRMQNLKTTRKPFGAESRFEYVALYCNDQIENMVLDLEPLISGMPYFRHKVKHLFNKMKSEVRSYSIGRRRHTEISESEFADLMIEMEERYKSISTYWYSAYQTVC